jgi:hypothetical protein
VSSQSVPLVIYKDGIRHVVGEAVVDLETGEVTATIPQDKLEAGFASCTFKALLPSQTVGISNLREGV